MATKWKLPRTKRDVYKLLDSVGDAHDDGCVPVLTAVDGGVSDGENNRQNAADVRRCDPSPGVDSEFGNSSQIELADMVRRKIHFGEDSINHDGSKRPNSRDSRDSDFVDMARTREHTDLDRLQEKGVSPLLPSVDELDSPTKDEPKKESPKRQRGKKQLTKDQVDYELGQASFSYFDIFIYLVSIGSYVADVGSDCWVAYLYYSGTCALTDENVSRQAREYSKYKLSYLKWKFSDDSTLNGTRSKSALESICRYVSAKHRQIMKVEKN